ncbi:MAG: DUF2452 domain-containing protein [Pseudomonadota bacterium]|nr:DUF2452 domain-containing protein [Pseudomonadota bacterium]
MKKPDLVADNKSTMPYGDSVGAPAITEVDTTGYRQMKSKEASAKLRGRYEELQEEFRQLVATSEDTQRMYDATVSFVPIIGHIYHLYRRENGEEWVSMIAPEEFGTYYHEYIGSYRLATDSVWIRV